MIDLLHQNQITNSNYTIIGAGKLNTVREASTHSVIAGGISNDIANKVPFFKNFPIKKIIGFIFFHFIYLLE